MKKVVLTESWSIHKKYLVNAFGASGMKGTKIMFLKLFAY